MSEVQIMKLPLPGRPIRVADGPDHCSDQVGSPFSIRRSLPYDFLGRIGRQRGQGQRPDHAVRDRGPIQDRLPRGTRRQVGENLRPVEIEPRLIRSQLDGLVPVGKRCLTVARGEMDPRPAHIKRSENGIDCQSAVVAVDGARPASLPGVPAAKATWPARSPGWARRVAPVLPSTFPRSDAPTAQSRTRSTR